MTGVKCEIPLVTAAIVVRRSPFPATFDFSVVCLFVYIVALIVRVQVLVCRFVVNIVDEEAFFMTTCVCSVNWSNENEVSWISKERVSPLTLICLSIIQENKFLLLNFLK